MTKKYNKLVRDKIPEIIIADGEQPVCRILGKKEFVFELKKKLIEESHELSEAKGKSELLNELADVQEIIDAISKEHSIGKKEIAKAQSEKRKKRGGFLKKIFLVESIE